MAVQKMLVGGTSGGIVDPTLGSALGSETAVIAGYDSGAGKGFVAGGVAVASQIAQNGVIMSGLPKPSANRSITNALTYDTRAASDRYTHRTVTINTSGELILSDSAMAAGYYWGLCAEYDL